MTASYLTTMQFKVLHRVTTNYFYGVLKPLKIVMPAKKVDNLEHYFYYCCDVEHFWRQVENWTSKIIASKVKLMVLEVLIGFLNFDSEFYYAINYVIIIAKFYLSKAKKWKTNTLSLHFVHPQG